MLAQLSLTPHIRVEADRRRAPSTPSAQSFVRCRVVLSALTGGAKCERVLYSARCSHRRIFAWTGRHPHMSLRSRRSFSTVLALQGSVQPRRSTSASAFPQFCLGLRFRGRGSKVSVRRWVPHSMGVPLATYFSPAVTAPHLPRMGTWRSFLCVWHSVGGPILQTLLLVDCPKEVAPAMSSLCQVA